MTFNKVSVLIPTRQRLDRLQTLLRSYNSTTRDGDTSELIFRVDDDDLDSQDLLLSTVHRVIIGPRGRGYQDMPRFYNEMLPVSTGDVLMCGNDDMVFKTPDWARLILEVANQYPDGLFDLGVSTHNETHYPFSIISRDAAVRMGFVWDPRIFWGDIFLRDVMAAFGRCVMLPEVKIDHDWVGHRPDKTFLEGDQQDIMRRDPTYWSGTHTQAVEDAVATLKGVRKVYVCVPVLKRYDLLRNLLLSLKESTVKPHGIYIIDNGLKGLRLAQALAAEGVLANVFTPDTPLGVAQSWNWFIKHVPEDRVIVNDDVTFAPDSLARLTAPDADLIWAKGCGFSCFVIRNSCIAKLGLFDEAISPGYGYYEDDDYLQRLDGRGTRAPSAVAAEVDCGVRHEHSATLKVSTAVEMEEHHRKFTIAQRNYVRKWGLEEAFERERVLREMTQ